MYNKNVGLSITVIIPVYNTAAYLKECLVSLKNQTFQNFEIILIDDGSADMGGGICDIFASSDDRTQVIKQKNAGQSAARNVAMQMACGEYIYFLDSDDYIANDLLEKLYAVAKEKKADVVFFEAESFYDDEQDHLLGQFNYDRSRDYGTDTCRKQFKELLANDEYYVCVPLHFYNKTFLKDNQITFKEGIVFEDNLYSAQVYFSNGIAVHLNAIGYFRRVHAQSTMTSRNESALIHKFNSLVNVYYGISKKVSSMKPYDEIMWKYISQCIDSVLYAYNGLSECSKKKYRCLQQKVRFHAFWQFGVRNYLVARKCADPVMKIIVRGIHLLLKLTRFKR